jgi:hypothetical protein
LRKRSPQEDETVALMSTTPMSAKLSLGFAVGFGIILVALHLLEPEFGPPHLISEYELGRFGWLMSIAFFLLGAASLTLAHALWSGLPRNLERGALSWLVLIGMAYFSAGIFRTNPAPTDQMSQVANLLHGISGMIVIFSSPIVFALLRSRMSTSTWSTGAASMIQWLTIAAWASTSAFIASGFAGVTNAVVGGWMNRLTITSYSAWLMAAAWVAIKSGRLMRDTRGTVLGTTASVTIGDTNE